MEKITVQVQSVLYNNNKESLKKAIAGLANAQRVAMKEKNIDVRLKIRYGDASPKAIFTDVEITNINEKYQEIEQLEYTIFGFNSGSAKGHNLLGERCESEYMMIMNPDVIVSPQFFCYIFKGFLDSKVGMIEARQTPVEHPKEYDIKTLETDWATTACAIFPTKLFKMLNGFDSDSFFMYCDDLDFSWRMRLEGYKILYQPLAPVYHAKRLSSDAQWQPTEAEKYYSAEASLLMAYKYSNFNRVKEIEKGFTKSGDTALERAVEAFKEREKNGQLPKPIDKEGRVAKFVGDFFTEHRFVM